MSRQQFTKLWLATGARLAAGHAPQTASTPRGEREKEGCLGHRGAEPSEPRRSFQGDGLGRAVLALRPAAVSLLVLLGVAIRLALGCGVNLLELFQHLAIVPDLKQLAVPRTELRAREVAGARQDQLQPVAAVENALVNRLTEQAKVRRRVSGASVQHLLKDFAGRVGYAQQPPLLAELGLDPLGIVDCLPELRPANDPNSCCIRLT